VGRRRRRRKVGGAVDGCGSGVGAFQRVGHVGRLVRVASENEDGRPPAGLGVHYTDEQDWSADKFSFRHLFLRNRGSACWGEVIPLYACRAGRETPGTLWRNTGHVPVMSDLEAEYRLDYFEEEGFERKECPSCGAHFWTRDADRELCGEPPCEDYSFIDDPGFPEAYSLSEMREAFPLILRGAWPRANRPVSGRREPLARRRTPDAGVDLRLPAARHVGTDPPPANPSPSHSPVSGCRTSTTWGRRAATRWPSR